MIGHIQTIDGYESMTPQEIADILTADKRTQSPIQLAALTDLLNKRQMLVRRIRVSDSGEKWTGSVNTMIAFVDANGSPEQVAQVSQWFSHITNPRLTEWATDEAGWAAAFEGIRAVFAGQGGLPTQDDFASIIALGGGYRIGDVTAEEVKTALAEEAARVRGDELNQASQAAFDSMLAVYQSGSIPTNEQIVAAFATALDAAGGG